MCSQGRAKVGGLNDKDMERMCLGVGRQAGTIMVTGRREPVMQLGAGKLDFGTQKE